MSNLKVIYEQQYENPSPLQINDNVAITSNNVYSLSVPSLATDPLTIKTPNGEQFTWKPAELCYKDSDNNIDYIVDSSPTSLSTIGTQARYRRTSPLSDDVFNAEPNRVKHWVILNEVPRKPADYLSNDIVFGISGIIGNLNIPEGKYDNISSDNFVLPQPIIKDLVGNEITGYYEVVNIDETSQQLFLWFDASYLNNAIYPIMIDPTVIVSSTNTIYDLAVDGNGVIYACITQLNDLPSTIYKSVDSGNTWVNISFPDNTRAKLYCDNNNVLHAVWNDISNKVIKHNIYSNNTWSSSEQVTSYTGTTYNYIANFDIDNTNNLHIVYDDGTNIYYVTGITGSWSAPLKILQPSTLSSTTCTYPDIFIYNNSLYVCAEVYTSSTGYARVYYATCTNGVWTSWTVVDKAGTSSSRQPNIVVDSNGYVHIMWQGNQSAGSGVIIYEDNNVSGSWVETNIGGTSGDYGGHISCDKSGKTYIFYYNGSPYTAKYRVFNSGLWGSATTIASATNLKGVICFKKEKASLIGYSWSDGTNINFDKFSFNNAPLTPTNLVRGNFDANSDSIFTWQFNDPDIGSSQSAYQVQIIRYSDNVIVKDTGKVINTNSSYTLPGGTLTNGVQYQWKVTTWDNYGLQSPWSSLSTFVTALSLTATIINPSTDYSAITTSNVTVSWSVSDVQSAYQIRLTDMNDNQLFTTGKVSDYSSRSLTIGYTLFNNTNYKIKISAWNNSDIQGSESVRIISVSFTPPTPSSISGIDNGVGGIVLTISNTSSIQYVDIYRSAKNNNNYIRIASNLQLGNYIDNTVAGDTIYYYKIRTYSSNGTYADGTEISLSVTISNTYLSSVSDSSNYVELSFNPTLQGKFALGREQVQFAGREKPVSLFNEHSSNSPQLSYVVSGIDQFNLFKSLIYSRQTLLMRDFKGNKIYGTVEEFDYTEQTGFEGNQGNIYYTITFTLDEVDYSEVV